MTLNFIDINVSTYLMDKKIYLQNSDVSPLHCTRIGYLKLLDEIIYSGGE